MTNLYAKIDSVNETTYDTNTLSVIDEKGMRMTLRIDESKKLREGEVYYFEVEAIVFKDRDQFLVNTFKPLQECQVSMAEKERVMKLFYQYAPVNMTKIKEEIEQTLHHINHPVIKEITTKLYEQHAQSFYLYPAATKFHHAYIGGLAHHTHTMLQLVDGLIKTYPFLNRDLLVAGILLHDICKTSELSDYRSPEYTREGRLIGHITMGVKAVYQTALELGYQDDEVCLLLEHMMLSHHYYGNFGSPKKPNIPEALALHFIDNIDSKFAVLGAALEDIKEGDFTPPLPVLDREKFYKAKLKK